MTLRDIGHQRREGVGIGNVEPACLNGAARISDRASRGFQLLLAARADHDHRPARSQEFGRSPADAITTTGHDCNAVVEPPVHAAAPTRLSAGSGEAGVSTHCVPPGVYIIVTH